MRRRLLHVRKVSFMTRILIMRLISSYEVSKCKCDPMTDDLLERANGKCSNQ